MFLSPFNVSITKNVALAPGRKGGGGGGGGLSYERVRNARRLALGFKFRILVSLRVFTR